MKENNDIKITQFFENNYCDYGSYDNYRKISSAIDGLKPSARKCIYIVLKDKIKDMFKVQNLMTRISQKTNYIHGATSLYGVIVGLAQNFVGTNNIPLLQRKGNFGNRLIPEAAADRYIFTCEQKYLEDIFKEEDKDILIEQIFEGDVIEPKFFVPIIPLLIINGSIGLTTGFNQKIMPRNPKEVIDWLECKLTKKKFKGKLLPHYNNFKGTIKELELGNYQLIGQYQKISANKIQITDIPCGPGNGGYNDLKSYLAILDKLVDDKKIKEYNDYSESNNYKIVVTFWRNQGLNIDTCDIIKELKLSKIVNESYTSLNEDNKVVEYKNVEQILQNFYKVRYDYYQKRKDDLVNKMTNKILLTVSKYTFIKNVIDEIIILKNKTDEQIIKQLKPIKNIITQNDNYDYLLNMPLSSITKQKFNKLKDQIKNLKDQISQLKNTSIEDMWKNDLIKLKSIFK